MNTIGLDGDLIPTRSRQAAGRKVVALGCLGLSLLSAALLIGLEWWIVHPPPPQPCPLPVVSIPRPGDLFAWSADGKRLLAANRLGELWTVQFAEASVRPLPPIRGMLWHMAWDARGRPLIITWRGSSTQHLSRLNDRGTGWDRLPLTGVGITVSPDGRWAAAARGMPVPSRQAGAAMPDSRGLPRLPAEARRILTVLDLTTGRSTEEHWPPVSRGRGPDGGSRSLQMGFRLTRPPRPAPSAVYQPRPVPGEWLRKRWRDLAVPGVKDGEYEDWSLTVLDAQRRVLRRVPLGRRSSNWTGNRPLGGWTFTWKAASISPDGRWLVVRAADDTLRWAELRGEAP